MFRTAMTLDRANRTLTFVSGGLVAGVIVVVGCLGRGPAGLLAALPLVIAGVLAVAWAMAPRELVVEGGVLRIERRAWKALSVPLASIESAAPVSALGAGVVRVGGVGGFFGSYGLFWSKSLGRFRLYATRRGQAVLVRRRGAVPLVLTPDDVAGTVAALDPRSPRA